MNYDDLVDQFIVNDPECNEESVETAKSSEKVEAEKVEAEESSENNKNSLKNDFLMKIHLKSLIQSRHQSRQTVKLEQIRDRNKKFENFKQRIKANATGNGSINNNFGGNKERRRRILRERIVKEGEEVVVEEEGIKEGIKEGDNEAESIELENGGDLSESTITATTRQDELIPCRLELDHEGYKLSDVFLLPSRPSPPSQPELDLISVQLCQEYDLPVEPFQTAISKCLRDQVEEWDVYQGALEGMKEAVPYDEIGPVPLRLDIIVGMHRLEDQLEVSLNPQDSNTTTMRHFVDSLRSPDPRVLPESDYLPFKPLILHNLLEQLMLWRKAIVFGGFHRDPRSNNLKFHDGDVAVLLNDPSSNNTSNSVRRHFAHTNTFTPILSVLTAEELEKIEMGRERESRRRRRTATVPSTSSLNTSSTKKSATSATTPVVNNLSGTVRSPPRTLPTPTSYRGSLHRSAPANANSDDEGSATGAPRKRGRKSKN